MCRRGLRVAITRFIANEAGPFDSAQGPIFITSFARLKQFSFLVNNPG